jgi:hypothetical protein
MLRRVTIVRTEVSEERGAFIIRVTRIGEIGTTLACNKKWKHAWKKCYVKASNFTKGFDSSSTVYVTHIPSNVLNDINITADTYLEIAVNSGGKSFPDQSTEKKTITKNLRRDL